MGKKKTCYGGCGFEEDEDGTFIIIIVGPTCKLQIWLII